MSDKTSNVKLLWHKLNFKTNYGFLNLSLLKVTTSHKTAGLLLVAIYPMCIRTTDTATAVLSESSVEVVDPAKSVLVVDGFVDCDEEGEGRGKLHSFAQLLVTPVETVQSLSQVTSTCSLQSILEQLGLIGLVP